MTILSAVPFAVENSPLSPEVMAETRRIVRAACGDDRVLLHGQVVAHGRCA